MLATCFGEVGANLWRQLTGKLLQGGYEETARVEFVPAVKGSFILVISSRLTWPQSFHVNWAPVSASWKRPSLPRLRSIEQYSATYFILIGRSQSNWVVSWVPLSSDEMRSDGITWTIWRSSDIVPEFSEFIAIYYLQDAHGRHQHFQQLQSSISSALYAVNNLHCKNFRIYTDILRRIFRFQLVASLGQAAHTHVPLSPNSIIWYRPIGGDALWLGR